jgi:hypothetical protein
MTISSVLGASSGEYRASFFPFQSGASPGCLQWDRQADGLRLRSNVLLSWARSLPAERLRKSTQMECSRPRSMLLPRILGPIEVDHVGRRR